MRAIKLSSFVLIAVAAGDGLFRLRCSLTLNTFFHKLIVNMEYRSNLQHFASGITINRHCCPVKVPDDYYKV